MSTANHGEYYIPEPSKWPLVGTIALTTTVIGAVNTIHSDPFSINWLLPVGLLLIAYLFFGWFGAVIDESMAGKYNAQVDRSFRIGMLWFIFSEVMFFAAFFGALFYIRVFVVDWLDGGGNNFMTHQLLWPGFEGVWPLLSNPDNAAVPGAEKAMGPGGLPAINTAILLLSSVTVTIAHHGLRQDHRKPLVIWLAITVALGATFLALQMYEYVHAYRDLGLRFDSGVYGNTFFILTGFHGMHVTIGTIMLLTMLVRALKGHFTSDNHFAFEAVAWYWHFVDVVWLGLFIFVYWL